MFVIDISQVLETKSTFYTEKAFLCSEKGLSVHVWRWTLHL